MNTETSQDVISWSEQASLDLHNFMEDLSQAKLLIEGLEKGNEELVKNPKLFIKSAHSLMDGIKYLEQNEELRYLVNPELKKELDNMKQRLADLAEKYKNIENTPLPDLEEQNQLRELIDKVKKYMMDVFGEV